MRQAVAAADQATAERAAEQTGQQNSGNSDVELPADTDWGQLIVKRLRGNSSPYITYFDKMLLAKRSGASRA